MRTGPPSRRRLLAAGCLLALAAPAFAQPAQEKLREALVKAALLHKLASFVEWPEGTFGRPDTPLRIGVVGNDEVWRDLTDLAKDRDRDGRPVVAVRLNPGDSLAGFHILYLKAPSPARMAELVAQAPEGVLTVADTDGNHVRGSVMSFFLEESRVRFGVSLDAAARQKLRLSPRLVAVARNVQGSLPPAAPAVASAAARF